MLVLPRATAILLFVEIGGLTQVGDDGAIGFAILVLGELLEITFRLKQAVSTACVGGAIGECCLEIFLRFHVSF